MFITGSGVLTEDPSGKLLSISHIDNGLCQCFLLSFVISKFWRIFPKYRTKLVEFTLERKFPKLSQFISQTMVKIGPPKKTTGSLYLSSV
jgi:hypothetical protein